jgi:hypothetical protein
MYVNVYVCVYEREREREFVCVVGNRWFYEQDTLNIHVVFYTTGKADITRGLIGTKTHTHKYPSAASRQVNWADLYGGRRTYEGEWPHELPSWASVTW